MRTGDVENDEVMNTINRQISSLFLQRKMNCSDGHGGAAREHDKNHKHHTHNEHQNFE
jgi:hypothetical protein